MATVTNVRSAEAEEVQSPSPPSPDSFAVDEGSRHRRLRRQPPSAVGDRERVGRRRHHSLPRQLLRVFEAAPSRGYVQGGVALRMEPFESPSVVLDDDDAGAGVRPHAAGSLPRPRRARTRWNSTPGLPIQPPLTDPPAPQPPPQSPLTRWSLGRPLYGADIPEPLSSYERHVRWAIERHRQSGSVGQLRRYATLADLSDLEAAAAEVERRVNGDGEDHSQPAFQAWLPPPPLPPRLRPKPRMAMKMPLQPPPPQPELIYTRHRNLPPRFSAHDSFDAIRRAIESAAADAGSATTAASTTATRSSRLLEENRWLLDAVDSGGGGGSGLNGSRGRQRWPTTSAPRHQAAAPPVPLRRNRTRQQQPPPPPPPPPVVGSRWLSHGFDDNGHHRNGGGGFNSVARTRWSGGGGVGGDGGSVGGVRSERESVV